MPNLLPDETPESQYRKATTVPERRRIQSAVIEAYRGRVAALVRRTVFRRDCWQEAEQVGLIGVLLALEKFDPAPRPGYERGPAFWAFAFPVVRDEIRNWLGVGVYWRKPANRGRNAARQTNREVTRLHQQHASLDAEVPGADGATTLHDQLASPAQGAEDLVGDAEVKARLRAFAHTLSTEDREILFSENSQRVRSRHHLSLVERATAFVKGADDVDHRGTSHRDTSAAPAGKP